MVKSESRSIRCHWPPKLASGNMPTKETIRTTVASRIPVFETAGSRDKMSSELIRGERFIVERQVQDLSIGRCENDGFVGACLTHLLCEPQAEPTHIVAVRLAPSLKTTSLHAEPYELLSIGSRLTIIDEVGEYSLTDRSEWVRSRYLLPVDTTADCPLCVAKSLEGIPFVGGGRSGYWMDCSGFVQQVAQRVGISSPRDILDQRASIGASVDTASGLAQAGDVIFFGNHVAMIHSPGAVLHASSEQWSIGTAPSLAVVRAQLRGDFARACLLEECPTVPAIRRLKNVCGDCMSVVSLSSLGIT
jgi:cell wall-associated NlpC family hydrolase